MRSTRLLRVATAVVAAMFAASIGGAAASAAPAPAPAPAPRADARPVFIVTLRPGTDPGATVADSERRGASIAYVYRQALPGFAGRMGAELAEELRRDARVERVERDAPVRASATQTAPPWGLDRVDQRNLPLDTAYTYDHAGTGVSVYVIDSGVRSTHADFTGRVAAGYTAIADGYGTADCNGHGTHVAGTAAGATYGAAKAATVVPVRVLDCNGSGTISGVIAGIDWVTAHHASGTPAVANLSLGGAASSALDTAVRNSISDGITYVVAAGNENVDACTKSPARVGEAVTVAASTSSDSRASYSNWGLCVDLFAPGSSVSSTYHSSDTATATMSGTSMGAPHVAGIAALHLTMDPAATPATVSSVIASGATPNIITDAAGSPNRLAYSGLTASDTLTATAPATPDAPAATSARRAISLGWKAPADGGSPITGYNVRVHRASDGTVVKTASLSATTLKTTVGGLTANTTYYGTVQAKNAVGTSSWSAPSNTATATR